MDTTPIKPVSPWEPLKDERVPKSSRPKLLLFVERLLPAAILLFIAVGGITGYLEKWLWMGQLHYTGIFWTLFSVQWTMFAAAFIFVFLFMSINLGEALQHSGAIGGRIQRELVQEDAVSSTDLVDLAAIGITPKLLRSAVVIFSLGLAWLAADAFFSQWDTYLRFQYGASFGVADPLFGIDVGFYVFQLPFYRLLQASLLVLTIATLSGVSGIYLYSKGGCSRSCPGCGQARQA